MTVQIHRVVTLSTEECCECGVIFAMPDSLQRKLKANGEWFYCPNGHRQHYTETEAQRLQKQLDRERRTREAYQSQARSYERQRDEAQRSAAAHKGQATKLRKRAAAGTCPCCKRTVSQLSEHMKTKHPEFVKEAGQN
jgi:hypothetical protein